MCICFNFVDIVVVVVRFYCCLVSLKQMFVNGFVRANGMKIGTGIINGIVEAEEKSRRAGREEKVDV